LYEVRDENTEELLRHFLYKEIGIDFRIDFGNVHRFSHKPRGKRVSNYQTFFQLLLLLFCFYHSPISSCQISFQLLVRYFRLL
jgi:hypothetical protein